jgi:hypothetical protein
MFIIWIRENKNKNIAPIFNYNLVIKEIKIILIKDKE